MGGERQAEWAGADDQQVRFRHPSPERKPMGGHRKYRVVAERQTYACCEAVGFSIPDRVRHTVIAAGLSCARGSKLTSTTAASPKSRSAQPLPNSARSGKNSFQRSKGASFN